MVYMFSFKAVIKYIVNTERKDFIFLLAAHLYFHVQQSADIFIDLCVTTAIQIFYPLP